MRLEEKTFLIRRLREFKRILFLTTGFRTNQDRYASNCGDTQGVGQTLRGSHLLHYTHPNNFQEIQ